MVHTIDEVLKEHGLAIEKVCRRYAASSNLLEWEDLAQECKIRIYRKWAQIEALNPDSMRGLIITISRNCCLNVLRDIKRQMPDDYISLNSVEAAEIVDPGTVERC